VSEIKYIRNDIGHDIVSDIVTDIGIFIIVSELVCDIAYYIVYDIVYDIVSDLVLPAGFGGFCCQQKLTATTDSEDQGHMKWSRSSLTSFFHPQSALWHEQYYFGLRHHPRPPSGLPAISASTGGDPHGHGIAEWSGTPPCCLCSVQSS
jgi:hypothetical protein